MNKNVAIIVGGTGQFGRVLSAKLLKKNFDVIITTRSRKKANLLFNKKKISIINLNILNKKNILNILKKFKPKFIFYFAGLSSPKKSFFKPRETYLSNVKGCKNFLEVIWENELSCKFLNSSSCEIFAKTNKKLNLKSKKKPISPYGESKLISYAITKQFREREKIKSYNAIIFNTESEFRDSHYLIPKICNAAIKAYKFQTKTAFGNLKIAREWNWCDEQCDYMLKFLNKTPQDFILSNGKLFSAKNMLSYAFSYFNLNYKKFVYEDKKLFRKSDFNFKKSNYTSCLKKNNLYRNPRIFGKKLIIKLIKFYLNEKKYK